jgi:hypothetical protein
MPRRSGAGGDSRDSAARPMIRPACRSVLRRSRFCPGEHAAPGHCPAPPSRRPSSTEAAAPSPAPGRNDVRLFNENGGGRDQRIPSTSRAHVGSAEAAATSESRRPVAPSGLGRLHDNVRLSTEEAPVRRGRGRPVGELRPPGSGPSERCPPFQPRGLRAAAEPSRPHRAGSTRGRIDVRCFNRGACVPRRGRAVRADQAARAAGSMSAFSTEGPAGRGGTWPPAPRRRHARPDRCPPFQPRCHDGPDELLTRPGPAVDRGETCAVATGGAAVSSARLALNSRTSDRRAVGGAAGCSGTRRTRQESITRRSDDLRASRVRPGT